MWSCVSQLTCLRRGRSVLPRKTPFGALTIATGPFGGFSARQVIDWSVRDEEIKGEKMTGCAPTKAMSTLLELPVVAQRGWIGQQNNGFKSMLRGEHESLAVPLFRPLTLELCSRPFSYSSAKCPSLKPSNVVVQITFFFFFTATSESGFVNRDKAGMQVRNNICPPMPNLCLQL